MLCPNCEKTVFGSSQHGANAMKQTNQKSKDAKSNVVNQQRDLPVNLDISLSPTGTSAPIPGPSPSDIQ